MSRKYRRMSYLYCNTGPVVIRNPTVVRGSRDGPGKKEKQNNTSSLHSLPFATSNATATYAYYGNVHSWCDRVRFQCKWDKINEIDLKSHFFIVVVTFMGKGHTFPFGYRRLLVGADEGRQLPTFTTNLIEQYPLFDIWQELKLFLKKIGLDN